MDQPRRKIILKNSRTLTVESASKDSSGGTSPTAGGDTVYKLAESQLEDRRITAQSPGLRRAQTLQLTHDVAGFFGEIKDEIFSK